MEKKNADMKSCLHPMPRVLVSCRGLDGEDNALAVAYCCNCSFDPPMVMVGIIPERYSHAMIKGSGCFIVNLVEKSFKKTFEYLGTHSRRDGDKLAAMGVKLEEGEKVNAPMLADCPVNIECTIVNSIKTGSHEMFVGKIECVHTDPRLLDENGKIDFSQADLL